MSLPHSLAETLCFSTADLLKVSNLGGAAAMPSVCVCVGFAQQGLGAGEAAGSPHRKEWQRQPVMH